MTQCVDGQALEEQREPRPRLRPRHQDLHYAVLAAFNARNARVKVGLELATVKMPLRPLLGVIVEREFSRTLGTGPRRTLWVFGPHVPVLPFEVPCCAAHGPQRLQAQQVLQERGVLNRSLLARPSSYPSPSGYPCKTRNRHSVPQASAAP